jgi:hypothetical protein
MMVKLSDSDKQHRGVKQDAVRVKRGCITPSLMVHRRVFQQGVGDNRTATYLVVNDDGKSIVPA